MNKLVDGDLVGGLGGGLGSSSLRKGGPVSQQEACRSLTDIGRVPISAGLYSVAMYCHWFGLDILRMILIRDTSYRLGLSFGVSFLIQASTSLLSE